MRGSIQQGPPAGEEKPPGLGRPGRYPCLAEPRRIRPKYHEGCAVSLSFATEYTHSFGICLRRSAFPVARACLDSQERPSMLDNAEKRSLRRFGGHAQRGTRRVL